MRIPYLSQIVDQYVRENFLKLDEYLRSGIPVRGFKPFEVSFTRAVDNYKLRHNLGYIPKDIIRTRLTGDGAVQFNYDLFDEESLDLTVSGACTIRLLVGTFTTERD